MLKVNAKTKANMAGVTAKVAKISKDEGLGLYLATQAAKGMDKFVPKRTGALAASAIPSPFKVQYVAPYAVYVYHGEGKNFNKNGHPSAQAYWDRAYISAGGAKQLAEAGTAYLRSH